MKENKKKMEAHLRKPCEICGDVGFEELIVTCSKCGVTREHSYCMQTCIMEVPEVWVCGECMPRHDGKEDIQNATRKVHPNFANQGGSTDDSGRHAQLKRQKAVETGKVKFLSSEEVIRLASGAVKGGSSSKRNAGFRSSSSISLKSVPPKTKPNPRIIPQYNTKLSTHDKAQMSPTANQLATRTSIERKPYVSPAKEYGFKGKQMASMKSDKEDKACKMNVPAKEVKHSGADREKSNRASCASPTPIRGLSITEERTPAVPVEKFPCSVVNAHGPPAKVVETAPMNMQKATNEASCRHPPLRLSSRVIDSGIYSSAVIESKDSDAQEYDLLNILPKLRLYRCYAPAVQPVWNGGFKSSDAITPNRFYEGFRAQPSRIVHRKAYEFSQKMPRILHVRLLPRCSVWASIFQNDYPDFADIALYFFPSDDVNGAIENHACLFNHMETEKLMMSSCIDGVELFIFTSKQLDVDSQDVIGKSGVNHFLWGVFHNNRKNDQDLHVMHEFPLLVSPSYGRHSDHANGDCSEAIDMEIDMIGGEILGIPDKPIPKESSRMDCGESNEEIVDENRELESTNYNALKDVKSTTEQVLLESEQVHLSPEVARKIDRDFNFPNYLQTSLGRSSNATDANIPPGFEEMTRLNSCKILFEDKASEENPRPLTPIKMESRSPQSLTRTKDEYFQSHPLMAKTETENFEDYQLRHWSPPPTGWVKLNVATSTKGNPGAAGAGGVMRDESGKWILGYIINLGTQKRLGAEFWAIFQGLMVAWARGFKKILVESESLNAIECVNRSPSALDPNRVLIDCCINLIKREWLCKVDCIFKESNTCANRLVTHFEDHPLGVTIFDSPPPSLVPFLQNDARRS